MSYLNFDNDEEGIRNANQALDDVRALLQRRTGTSSIGATASSSVDRDFALHFQLENLEDMLREITDARFARMLSGEDDDGVVVMRSENVEMLMFIVMTAREMLLRDRSDSPVMRPRIHRVPTPAPTSRAGGSGSGSKARSLSVDSRDSDEQNLIFLASPYSSTDLSALDEDKNLDLGLPSRPPNTTKGKQRASPQVDVINNRGQRSSARKGIIVGQPGLVDEGDDVILLHQEDRSSSSASPASPSSPWFLNLQRSIRGHVESPSVVASKSLPLNGPPTGAHSIAYPYFGWSSPPSDDEHSDVQIPSPTLSVTDFLSTFEKLKYYENPSNISIAPSMCSSTESFHSDPCVACGDPANTLGSLATPCGHWYCNICVVNLVTAYISDESLHPLRCCKTAIPTCSIEILLCDTKEVLSPFMEKLEEYSTPHDKRTYCPQRGCHRFITPSKPPATAGIIFKRLTVNSQNSAYCPTCSVSVCILCKELAHPGEKCEENKNIARLHELAKEKEWQTCSNCHSIVEKIEGCLHMTCRCGYEFCYRCGEKYTGPGMCGH
ncbi:hypothetical protein D9756_007980 [Leucocoprinus leucothites]|uniref:RBR-type E3 ubiquitin transferase n=1 Tax=Leucocoprinus leucothites TaxID=201217 RepID=A0A8H5D548_9AGAR|nr:hypothetical protein D9756_007980 [Leucoagaricus leucothites]